MRVCAIDTGYGNTKLAWPDELGRVKFDSFRSIAEHVAVRPEIFADMGARDTFYIEIEDRIFQVGRDTAGAATADLVLSQDYPLSPQYAALTLGALAYIFEDTGDNSVERLVLGLPVNTFRKHKAALEARFTGVHKIPLRAGRSTEFEVKSVKVVAQPAGSYLSWHKRSAIAGRKISNTATVLILDPGEFTIDWLVISHEKVVYERSGATNSGMSELYRFIASKFEQDQGVSEVSHELIRRGLMEGSATFRGAAVDFTDYLRDAKAKARTIVDTLLNKAGGMDDVDHVILAGGGATFYQAAIQARLKVETVEISQDPLYSNVYGFYLAGHK